MERHTYVYTTVFDDERQENAAIHAAAIMPLYVQRHPCRYMHEAATVPLYTQRQLPLHTNGRIAANIPFSIKRDCSTQARWQAIPQETNTRRASRSKYQTLTMSN